MKKEPIETVSKKSPKWEEIQKEMAAWVGGGPSGIRIVRKRVWCPSMDVYETEKEVVIQLEVGGLTKESFNITLEGNILAVSGTRPISAQGDQVQYHHVEIPNGDFERRMELNFEVRREDIKALYTEGILTITLPKAPEKKNAKITVKEI